MSTSPVAPPTPPVFTGDLGAEIKDSALLLGMLLAVLGLAAGLGSVLLLLG
jgi:hypothetical protein